jgi:hypothetical protein
MVAIGEKALLYIKQFVHKSTGSFVLLAFDAIFP